MVVFIVQALLLLSLPDLDSIVCINFSCVYTTSATEERQPQHLLIPKNRSELISSIVYLTSECLATKKRIPLINLFYPP